MLQLFVVWFGFPLVFLTADLLTKDRGVRGGGGAEAIKLINITSCNKNNKNNSNINRNNDDNDNADNCGHHQHLSFFLCSVFFLFFLHGHFAAMVRLRGRGNRRREKKSFEVAQMGSGLAPKKKGLPVFQLNFYRVF